MQQLLIERDGPVALVRFNNPPQGFMNSATLEDLEAATLEFDSDDSVRAVVYTGSQPDVFIKHYDTNELAGMARHIQKRGMKFSPERMLPERNIDIIFNRIGASTKPHIAAIVILIVRSQVGRAQAVQILALLLQCQQDLVRIDRVTIIKGSGRRRAGPGVLAHRAGRSPKVSVPAL